MRRHHLPQVLVVDDAATLRGVLRRLLEDEGYSVLEAADGLDALAILHAAPAPLVMLCNHHMPRLDGPSLFARIIADPLLPTRHAYLYMTADDALPSPFMRQLSPLHVHVLWKPFDPAELLAAIAAAVGRLASSALQPRLRKGNSA